MTTIDYHGIEFDFAEDGELNDLDITSSEEFFAHHWDESAFDGLLEVSDERVLDWAREHLADDAWSETGEPGVPLWKQYGCPTPWGNA